MSHVKILFVHVTKDLTNGLDPCLLLAWCPFHIPSLCVECAGVGHGDVLISHSKQIHNFFLISLSVFPFLKESLKHCIYSQLQNLDPPQK